MVTLRVSLLCAIMGAPAAQAQDVIKVPSGQPVTFQDVIWEVEGDENTYRFRYITPEISRNGGSVEFEQAEGDMRYLCEHSALPALIAQQKDVEHIVISLSDRAVIFGKADPAATQYFDSYAPQGNNCIWEGF